MASMDTQNRGEFIEQVVQVSRVSKKTKGGNKVGFSALTVVGDGKGKVGVGLGKAPDVSSAVRKGILLAKKHMIAVPLINGTIPSRVDVKVGAARVMLKPAPPRQWYYCWRCCPKCRGSCRYYQYLV